MARPFLATKADSRYTIAVGERYRVRRHGNHAPIIFIHGFYCDSAVWRAFAAHFSVNGHAVSCLDLPERVRLYDPPTQTLCDCGAEHWADYIQEAVLTYDEPPILIAHSNGGILAQIVASRLPIRALVLLAPAAPVAAQASTLAAMRLSARNLLRFRPFQKPWRPNLRVAKQTMLNAQPRSVRNAICETLCWETPRMVLDLGRKAGICDLPPSALKNIPTLLVVGEKDRIVTPAACQRVVEYYETAIDLEIMPGQDHWLHAGQDWRMAAQTVANWISHL